MQAFDRTAAGLIGILYSTSSVVATASQLLIPPSTLIVDLFLSNSIHTPRKSYGSEGDFRVKAFKLDH